MAPWDRSSWPWIVLCVSSVGQICELNASTAHLPPWTCRNPRRSVFDNRCKCESGAEIPDRINLDW